MRYLVMQMNEFYEVFDTRDKITVYVSENQTIALWYAKQYNSGEKKP